MSYITLKATPLRVDGFTFDLQRFDADTWDGTVGTVPDAVDGVITITTAEQLAALAVSVNDGNNYSGVIIKLGADIDLSGHNWTPIGTTSSNSFSGTFDGDGKTISNLTVNLPNNYNVGLFGYVVEGTIQNVTLTNATVQGKNFVGGLVGFNNGTIENCTVSGTVTGTGDKAIVGGLVGFNIGGTVSGNKYYSNAGEFGKNTSSTIENNTQLYKLTLPTGVSYTVTGDDPLTIEGKNYYVGIITLTSKLKEGYVYSTGDSFTISSDTTVTRIPNSANHYVFANNSGGYTLATNSNVGNYPDLIQAYQLTVPSGVSVATNNDVISSGDKYYVKVGSSATLTIGKSAALVGVTGYSNVAANSSGTVLFKPTADVTINANNLYYAVSGLNNVTASGNTSKTVNGTNYYAANSSVTLSSNVNGAIIGAATASGGSVTVNDNGTATLTTTSAASTVTPTLYYSVSGLNNVTASGNTSKTVNGTNYYAANSSVTLSSNVNGAIIGAATASGGSVTVNDNGTATLTTTSAASTVTPTLYYSVTVPSGVSVSGNTSKTVDGTTYYAGTVTLSATDDNAVIRSTSYTNNTDGTVSFTPAAATDFSDDLTFYYTVSVPNCVDSVSGTSIDISGTTYYQNGSTLTFTPKTGYVVNNVTVSSDTSITATVADGHYAFKDGDGYKYATNSNVASNNYPDLVQVYALTLSDGVTVTGDTVAKDSNGNTYAAGNVTLTAANGYTLQNVKVNGESLDDNTFTVSADATVLADCIKSINGGKGVEVGGTTGDFSDNNGVYSITASQENSTLTGNNNNNNVIIAGGGENILTGGGGNDTYQFSKGGGIVTDYGIGAMKSGDGSTLTNPLGTDVIKVDGEVKGVYFDRNASSKKSAKFTAVITYDSDDVQGDDTQIIVLQNINKKPTKYGSNPVYQTNDVAAATLKIWDISGTKQAVLSATKLKKLFHDDSELSELSQTVQTQLVKLNGIGDLNLPAVDQLNQTAQATFNGDDNG